MRYNEFIKNNKKNIEIVMLRHQGKTFKEISNHFNLSASRIRERYQTFIYNLYLCYNHYLTSIEIEINIHNILHFYESVSISVAYLEKTFEEHLNSFRNGAPPIVFGYCKEFPSYRILTEQQICYLEKKIIEEKIQKNKKEADIAKELDLTKEKVSSIYNYYIHKKVIIAIERIQPSVDFSFKHFIYDYSNYPTTRWKLIVSKYGKFVQDLLD